MFRTTDQSNEISKNAMLYFLKLCKMLTRQIMMRYSQALIFIFLQNAS